MRVFYKILVEVWAISSCVFFAHLACAQITSGLTKDNNPLEIKGFVNSQVLTNAVAGIDRRHDAFNFRLNGMFSLQSFGWKTSVNFHLADKRRVYSLNLPKINIPGYALVGASPSYRWATFHLGFRSMHFSDYSMAGHSYYGAGLELTPVKIKVQAFYGRLRRASAENIALRQSLDPTYKRMGWGVKLGYQHENEHIALSLFSAYDDSGSIPVIDSSSAVRPQENAVIGLTAAKNIGNNLVLEVDYAYSALTRNTRSEAVNNYQGSLGPVQRFFGIFNPRTSSDFRKALKTKLSFKIPSGNIHMMHERVDPGYRSLGSLFFNNDFENITGGGQFKAAKNKLMFTLNAGFQRNNLSGDETNTLRRLIGMVNAQWSVSDNASIGFSYSNFSTTNTLYAATIPIIQVDSVTLSLVNQQFSVSFRKASGQNNSSGFYGMLSYYRSQAIENERVLENQTNNNLMAHLSYTKKFPDSGLTWSGGIMLNRNYNGTINLFTFSPFMGSSLALRNNTLFIRGNLSLVNVYFAGSYDRRIVQPRISIAYRVTPQHSLDLMSYFTSQHSKTISLNNFREFNSRVSWKANF